MLAGLWMRRIGHVVGRGSLALVVCGVAGSVVTPVSLCAQESPAPQHSGRHASRNPEFLVPPLLRARVDFWKDVFTKYGENQIVVHHREFPQATFEILDFADQAERMDPVDLFRYKRKAGDERIKEYQEAFRALAKGISPRNSFEENIVRVMKRVPGGAEKYKRVVDEDLVRTQTGIREKYAEAVRRAGRYLPLMENVFEEVYGLPKELTRLPFVESSFDYTAYSAVGAAGIWQFMRKTGKIYMTVNNEVDERLDPIEATKAAAQYLQSAYSRLGSWPLAVTSYNHGVGGVFKKVREMGTNDLAKIVEHPTERAFGFASSNFYPEFLAAIEVFDDYKNYFPGIKIEAPLQVAQVRLTSAMSIRTIAARMGTTPEELKKYNYALLEPIWRGTRRVPTGYLLKVPHELLGKVNNLRAPEVADRGVGSASSAVHGGASYKVRKGDSLGSIAKKFRTTVALLRELNALTGDAVSPGTDLVIQQPKSVPRVESKASSPAKAVTEPKPATTTRQGTSRHTVKKGDTLEGIARQYGVSVEKLKKRNGLRGASIKAGQTLQVAP